MARAFNEEIHTHPALLNVVKDYWGPGDVNAAKLKLAQVLVLKLHVFLYDTTFTVQLCTADVH